VSADHFSGKGTAHDRRLAASGDLGLFELARNDAESFIDPIVECDFVGNSPKGSKPGAQGSCGRICILNCNAMLLYSGTNIRGDPLKSPYVVTFDRLDRKVTMSGMRKLIVCDFACDERDALDKFFGQV